MAPTGLHAVGHPPVDAGLVAPMRRDAGARCALMEAVWAHRWKKP